MPIYKRIFLPLLLMVSLHAAGQYSSLFIPAALKENANVVLRLDETEVKIKTKGNASIRHHYVYTILNPSGDKHAELVEYYSKLSKITGIDGNLYDAGGTKIKSVKKGDVKDYSSTSESNLADDSRVKYHNFNHSFYPYTVEYDVITEEEGIFHLPRWIPVLGENIAVEKSILKVTTPADYQLRYKTFNYPGDAALVEVKGNKEYSWQLNNYAAHTREPYSPRWHEITPSVFLAPSSFSMQRYEGTMNNWQEFGTFIYKLNAGRDQLPQNVQIKVHQLTDAVTDTRKKIEILYRYLQENTRYVSIQLGIGGWQTLDANFVATNGYGDCKALTNYMYALLKEAGVRSYQTLIHSGMGEESLMDDFASNQFNHVILCVPQAKDSIWLECTSKTSQPGYMGSSTGNRQALILDEKNSRLVNTPVYKAEDNMQVRVIQGTLAEDGILSANVSTVYTAVQQDGLDGLLEMYSKDQVTEHMRTRFRLSSYNIENFSHERTKAALPGISERITLKVKDFASVTGKRLFVNPNVLSVSGTKIKNTGTRKFDFNFNLSYTDVDTVTIVIPVGYKPESMPKDAVIKMEHAEYSSTYKIEKEKIIYTRLYSQKAARIPASKAQELTDFFDKVYKADHAKIVFIKEGL